MGCRTKRREETEVEPARPAEVTALYSEDRKVVIIGSAPYDLDFRIPVQGARALFFALGRLFFDSTQE